MKSSTLLSVFSVVIGFFFIAQGIWGLQSDVVFGVLSTNRTHAFIHIIFGAAAVITGFLRRARLVCLALGFILILVGILRFVPGTDTLMIELLQVNRPVAFLNLLLGSVSLLLAFPPYGSLPERKAQRRRKPVR